MSCSLWGCTYNGAVPNCCTNLGFLVVRGSGQNIPDVTETLVDWGVLVEENPPGTFDLAGDQFVCVRPGRYMFTVSGDIDFSANGYGEVRLYQNATLISDARAESDLDPIIKIGTSFTMGLSVGDIIQARVYQNSGVAAFFVGTANQFSGALISDR